MDVSVAVPLDYSKTLRRPIQVEVTRILIKQEGIS